VAQPEKSPVEMSNKHASAQEKYHKKKAATHTKVCRWVPNEHVKAFNKSVERMKSKWIK
jgi:hypothetical protein